MAKHAKTDSGQRVRRTAFAVLVGAVLAIVTVIGVLPEVLNLIHDGMGDFMSPEVRGWLATAAGFTAALSLTINRIMQLQALAPWLDRLGLGKAPESGETD